jgi:hypothetical protein
MVAAGVRSLALVSVLAPVMVAAGVRSLALVSVLAPVMP